MAEGSSVVRLEVQEGIAVITIDHPPVNALNVDVIDGLDSAAAAVAADPSVGVVVITGAGAKAFVAGADISEFPTLKPAKGEAMCLKGQRVFAKFEEMAVPVIAAINGFALGGGCELALACDIRVAAANAKLGQPEVNLGIIPGYGGTQRLVRVVGPGKAKQLILTADAVSADEAHRIGLVDEVVPEGEALNAATAMAKKILGKGPLAIKAAKRAVNLAMAVSLKEGLELEAHLFGDMCATSDQKEGAAAFLGKRQPKFQGN